MLTLTQKKFNYTNFALNLPPYLITIFSTDIYQSLNYPINKLSVLTLYYSLTELRLQKCRCIRRAKRARPLSIVTGNTALMHEFCHQHLHMRSARMKYHKVTEGEHNQKRLNMERSKGGHEIHKPLRPTLAGVSTPRSSG